MNRRKFLKKIGLGAVIATVGAAGIKAAKRKVYTYLYTLEEGRVWHSINSDTTPVNVLKQCRDKNNHFNMATSYGGPERTWLQFKIAEDTDTAVYVHSIQFPDGRIWDSYLRSYDMRIRRKKV